MKVKRPVTILAAAFVLLVATEAFAQGVEELVILTDGSELQGELVEKQVGDHVTVRLATGEVRMIPWADVKTSTTLVPGSTPLPPPLPPPDVPPASQTYSSPYASPTSSSSGGSSYAGGGGEVIHGYPEPDRRTPSLDEGRYFVGIAGGSGTPTGYFGVVTGYDDKFYELELGAGTGGTFGYALSAMARVHLPFGDLFRFGLGLGYSMNFLSAGQTSASGQYPFAPTISRFLNVELYQDYPLGRSVIMRFTSGVGFLLNAKSEYAQTCAVKGQGNFFGCSPPGDLATSPGNIGGAHHSPLIYFGAELLWRF